MKFLRNQFLLDIFVAVKHLPYLPYVFGDEQLFQQNSELNPKSYNNVADMLISAKDSLIGLSSKYQKQIDIQDTNVYFLNGICTNKNVWLLNAKHIESIFDFNVQPLHNKTKGVIPDLLECIFGRTFDLLNYETFCLYYTVLKSLKLKKKTIVIAHSQGGIIIAQIVKQLIKQNIDLSLLEIYTFASASDEMPLGNYHCEHFANTKDYVARIGVLEYKDNFYGNIFIGEHKGHLLNIHYLNNFKRNSYSNINNSKLLSYKKPTV